MATHIRRSTGFLRKDWFHALREAREKKDESQEENKAAESEYDLVRKYRDMGAFWGGSKLMCARYFDWLCTWPNLTLKVVQKLAKAETLWDK